MYGIYIMVYIFIYMVGGDGIEIVSERENSHFTLWSLKTLFSRNCCVYMKFNSSMKLYVNAIRIRSFCVMCSRYTMFYTHIQI